MVATFFKHSTSWAIIEIQIKTLLRFHLPPFGMAKLKWMKADAGVNVEKEEHLFTVDGSENCLIYWVN